MSELQKLIMDWSDENRDLIKSILSGHLEKIKDLDRDTRTKLLRHSLAEEMLDPDFAENICHQIIEFNVDVNPLDLALLKDDLHLTESLLKNDALLEESQSADYTPALYVFRLSTGSRKDMLLLLIKYGLNIDYETSFGDNLLNLFVRYVEENDQDATEIAKMLDYSGVLVDQANVYGWTPLIRSIRTQNIELITFLVENGANVNKKKWIGSISFAPCGLLRKSRYR